MTTTTCQTDQLLRIDTPGVDGPITVALTTVPQAGGPSENVAVSFTGGQWTALEPASQPTAWITQQPGVALSCVPSPLVGTTTTIAATPAGTTSLPFTGAHTAPTAALGALLVVVGGAALIRQRRALRRLS